MLHLITLSVALWGSANGGDDTSATTTTASTPKGAVEEAGRLAVGRELSVRVQAAAFDGLPAPARGIHFVARVIAFDQPRLRLSVAVMARSDRRVLARRRYVFPVRIRDHVVVPRHVIRAGQTIGSDDLHVVERELDGSAGSYVLSLDGLMGRVARVDLLPNRPIPSRSIQQPVMVRRGTGVTVRVAVGPLLVTMKGEALEDGAMGETIRIMNPSSSQVLSGRVVGHELVEVSK